MRCSLRTAVRRVASRSGLGHFMIEGVRLGERFGFYRSIGRLVLFIGLIYDRLIIENLTGVIGLIRHHWKSGFGFFLQEGFLCSAGGQNTHNKEDQCKEDKYGVGRDGFSLVSHIDSPVHSPTAAAVRRFFIFRAPRTASP